MRTASGSEMLGIRSPSSQGDRRQAFTLIELLVVIAVIAILAGLLMPTLGRSRERAKLVNCANNLHQLQTAIQMYAGDHDGRIPNRGTPKADAVGGNTIPWNEALLSYSVDREVLPCPTDIGHVDESYLLNGFPDDFVVKHYGGDWQEFIKIDHRAGKYPGIRLASIRKSSDTIVFGERKREASEGDLYMDFWPSDMVPSEHIAVVDHGKHRMGSTSGSGGSNHGFADGSVRYLKHGTALSPKNLWAVTDLFRDAVALPEL